VRLDKWGGYGQSKFYGNLNHTHFILIRTRKRSVVNFSWLIKLQHRIVLEMVPPRMDELTNRLPRNSIWEKGTQLLRMESSEIICLD
jgi:hypothetical protein